MRLLILISMLFAANIRAWYTSLSGPAVGRLRLRYPVFPDVIELVCRAMLIPPIVCVWVQFAGLPLSVPVKAVQPE